MPSKTTSASAPQFRLYRSQTNRVLGGVCGGISEAFDIDASIVRLIFVLLFVFGGSGFLLYLILWVVIPSQSQGTTTHESVRGNIDEIKGRAQEFAKHIKFNTKNYNSNSRSILGIAILLFGLSFLLSNFGFSFNLDKFWPMVLIIVGFYLITRK